MDITKTRCLISRAGQVVGHFNADTIKIDGDIYLVFEWSPDQKPMHLVRLDPSYLHPLEGWGEVTWMYEVPVADPRAFD